MRFILLLLLISLPFAAHAERVVEVQNIKVDAAKDRDDAMIKATRQAATQVWGQLNPGKTAPNFTPAQLDAMTSYIDVAGEVIRPNFYAATFNLGIRASALSQDTGATLQNIPAQRTSTTTPKLTADGERVPSWVLVVPVREADGAIKLWEADDAWAQAWGRAPAGRLPTAAPQADATDAKLLSAGKFLGNEIDLNQSLLALARKYTAPAIAVVLLRSSRTTITNGDELTVEVMYSRADGGAQSSSQSTIFVNATNAANPVADAVTEAIRQIGDLAIGPLADETETDQAALIPPATTYPVAGQPGLSPTYTSSYSGPASTLGNTAAVAGNRLSVRIPLASPADLTAYRRKIDAIPGAYFEITSLNRTYVEGNIVYNGDQSVLMQKLAESGLRQQ